MLKFLDEFINYSSILTHQNKNVTFFGSARFDMENIYCKMAKDLAFKLAKSGFAVLTGGGDGIMKAANMGAYESGVSPSVGLNIRLPFEQTTNSYLTSSFLFSSFFPRKYALINHSIAFIVFPGGFGTLDELFEILVLKQTKISNVKIFLVGSGFWLGLDNFIKTTLINEGAISDKDFEIYEISDDLDYIASEIKNIK